MPRKPRTAARKATKKPPAARSAPPAAPAAPAAKSKRRRGGSRRGKGGGGGGGDIHAVRLTSVPTGRQAYTDTRHWLLERHGSVCAYCERVVPATTITLDHVTPRRGQTAYDRRDNLVLCCKTCNAAKADKPILAFLLGNRKRVVALYKYGQHLSHQLVEMVKDLLPESERPPLPTKPAKARAPRRKWAEMHGGSDDAVSPYQEESPYLD